jgi:hypothetical protein
MMCAFDSPGPSDAEGGARVARLHQLSIVLGVELPPFQGPLVAFALGEEGNSERPVFLGGDLHEVHPEAHERRRHPRDPTLDSATLTFTDLEGEPLETGATQGIWCIRIEDQRRDAAPYLSIHDSEGRLRTWLILPPPRLMVGLGHFWLPSVSPFPGDAAGADAPPGGRTPRP